MRKSGARERSRDVRRDAETGVFESVGEQGCEKTRQSEVQREVDFHESG